jgi:microcystin-dependent protein
MSSVLKRTATFTAHEKPITGDIKMSFVHYDHLGWLVCDGRSLSIHEFNLLFQVIGYTFGGSIGSAFQLPNTGGKVLGSTNNVYPPGTDIGSATHTLTIGELPVHNHGTQTNTAQPAGNLELTSNSSTGITTQTAGSHIHTSNATGGNLGLAQITGSGTPGSIDNTGNEIDNIGPLPALSINSAGDHTHSITDPTHNHTLQSIGNNEAHNNIQPTLFIGNTFIYSGIPTLPGFPPNPASAWPFTTGLNPPLI